MKDQLCGKIELEKRLQDKDVWQAISNGIIEVTQGEVTISTNPDIPRPSILTIEEAINLRASPMSLEEIPQICSFANLLISLMGEAEIKDSWLLIGEIQLDGKYIPIVVIYNDQMEFPWFTSLTAEQRKGLLDFKQRCVLIQTNSN